MNFAVSAGEFSTAFAPCAFSSSVDSGEKIARRKSDWILSATPGGRPRGAASENHAVAA